MFEKVKEFFGVVDRVKVLEDLLVDLETHVSMNKRDTLSYLLELRDTTDTRFDYFTNMIDATLDKIFALKQEFFVKEIENDGTQTGNCTIKVASKDGLEFELVVPKKNANNRLVLRAMMLSQYFNSTEEYRSDVLKVGDKL